MKAVRCLLYFFIVLPFISLSQPPSECCTGISLNAQISGCDISICASPTDISSFCENFDYKFSLQTYDHTINEIVQNILIDDFCYSNFQGVPGREYTVTFITDFGESCDQESSSVTFTFPEDCPNCCIPFEFTTTTDGCDLSFCLEPIEELCMDPLRVLISLTDLFGNAIPLNSIGNNEYCFEASDLTGGLTYDLWGKINYGWACDVGILVQPTSITIPTEDCPQCMNECLILQPIFLSPGSLCIDMQFFLMVYDVCAGQFVSDGYQFSWHDSNGLVTTNPWVSWPSQQTISLTVIDPEGCIFEDDFGWFCVDPPLQEKLPNNITSFLKLSPNPANDVITLSGLDKKESLTISIISIEGKLMNSWKSDYSSELSIDLNGFISGQYVLVTSLGSQIISSEVFVKQ